MFPRDFAGWDALTALFGGTFDPPHLGHRGAVRGLFTMPGVARIKLLPSASPPHKPAVASTEARVEMLRRLFAADIAGGRVEVDLREIARHRLRPDVKTYTFDTLREMGTEGFATAFVIGTDQLAQLPSWHRFPEVLGLTHWLVLDRQTGDRGFSEAAREVTRHWEASGLIEIAHRSDKQPLWRIRHCPPGSARYLQWVPTEAPAISSTVIRQTLVRTGLPPAESLSAEVTDYLKLHRIYGTSPTKEDKK